MRFTGHLVGAVAIALLVLGCPSGGAGGTDGSAAVGLTDAAPDGARRDAGDAATAMALPDAAAETEIALPASASDELTARAKHLLEAVAHDNADLATDILFPRDAYIAARDGDDPGKVWDAKVISAFRRHVHLMHKRTKGVEKAQFVSFEIGRSVIQTTPKRRDWKRPLWKVKRSRLTFTVDGRTQRLEIAEVMGWRGAWYITRLR